MKRLLLCVSHEKADRNNILNM